MYQVYIYLKVLSEVVEFLVIEVKVEGSSSNFLVLGDLC